MIISRNIKKERETEKNLLPDNAVPDAALIISKQRHGDWNGTLGLWFDKKSQQFTESFNQPIIKYMED